MSSRRQVNDITTIRVGGVQVEGVSNVREAVFTHFEDHFKEVNINRPRATYLNFRTLSYREGAVLVKSFCSEVVKAKAWDCDSFKCPGPNGVNFGFIKDFWDGMKDDILRFVTDFHRNSKLLKGIDNTFITLIPNKDSLHSLNDFRPIFLVGSLYKVLVKLLANRLRSIISSVISDTRSTFVKRRQILDDILVVNEAVDEAKE